MKASYYLNLQSKHLGLVTGINGAPLYSDPKGEGLRTIRPINEWILPKDNHLDIWITWPFRNEYVAGLAKLKTSVFIADPGSPFPKPGELLVEYAWPFPPRQPEQYPHKISLPFEIKEVPPCHLWQEATTLTALSDGDKAAILSLVTGLCAALMEKNCEKAYELTAYKFSDDAAANGRSPEKSKATAIEQYEMIAGEPALHSSPLTADQAVFEIVGENRLVLVGRSNGGVAITIQSENSEYSIAVFVALIKGNWTIVR